METKLTAEERAIARWIEPNPHKPGPAEAWVLPYCVSEWVIIRQLQIENDDVAEVAEFFEIPVEAVEAAVAYYHRHQAPIDERIARNRAFFAAL